MKRRLLYFVMLGVVGSTVAQQQFENPGFENWEDAGTVEDEPVDWSSIKTSDVSSLNTFAPQVWDKSTDAHTGTYSLLVENKSAGFGIIANGIVTNGRIHADTDPELGYAFTNSGDGQWNTAFTSRPDSLVGWYKYTPSGGDHGKVDVIVHSGTSFEFPGDENGPSDIGRARFDMPNTTISSWTRFSVPFRYRTGDTPSYILAVLTSGDSTQAVNGSKAWFDDLELIYNPVSVEEITADDFTVATGTNQLKVWGVEGLSNKVNLELVDLQGRVVNNTIWTSSSDFVWNLGEVNGIFLLRFYVEDKIITKKVFIE